MNLNYEITPGFTFNNKTLLINNKSKNNINVLSLNKIRKICQKDLIKDLASFYADIIEPLNLKSVNWEHFLTAKQKKKYLTYLKEQLAADNNSFVTEYFFNTFPLRLMLFKRLDNLFFDGEWQEVPKYKHDSVTGRLSIKEGINYLTMKKTDRKLLKPNFEKVLLEVDFKSCEPYFYLITSGLIDESVTDVYQHVKDVLEISPSISRAKFKQSVISCLYGASSSTIKKLSGLSSGEIEALKDYLSFNELTEKLKTEFQEKGFIENYFGRPIFSDSNVVNYYIQSSAVDFCCLSFLEFLNNNKSLSGHAVIHDALLFSCEKDQIEKIKNIKKLGIKGIQIPVEIKEVNSNI